MHADPTAGGSGIVAGDAAPGVAMELRRHHLTSLTLALGACAPVPLGDGERRIAVRDLGTDVIVPQLFELAVEAAPLVIAMQRVTVAPTGGFLGAARETWRRARRTWKQSDAFGFGPASELQLDLAADAAQIDGELAGVAPLDEPYLEGLPGARKGFHALEYLLFRADGDDAAVLAALAGSPRRQAYLIAAAQNLVARVVELRDEWADDHADRLATPDAGDPDYPTMDRVMRVLVGRCADVAAQLADARLDAPGGVSSGEPHPELEESGRSDNSAADLADALRGVRNIYHGTRAGEPGKGLGGLVAAIDPAVDAAARAALEDAIAAVELIPRPYGAALAERRPEIAGAHAAVQVLRRILAADVTPALGLDDNDAD